MSAVRFLERHRNPIVAGLLLLGIVERVAWNVMRPTSGAAGEAMRVATSIGAGRGFADAYKVGQGATAHLMPLSPTIAGGVYALFGVETPAAEFVLACWSIGLAMGTYLLLFRAFGRLGTPLWARVGALAFACVAPAYVGQEAVDFRVWEGGLAVFLSALFLDRLLAMPEVNAGWRRITVLAAINAVLFFVNPAMGIAAYGCAFIFCVRHLKFQDIVKAGLVATACLLVLIVPWTLRNLDVLGSPIPLRSNAGLELALANYAGALEPGDRKQQFTERLKAIHPVFSAYGKMQAAGGEIAYSRNLGAETTAWMRDHPAGVARLMLRHLRQTFIPERWQFDVFGRSLSPTLRAAVTDFVGVCGLLAIALALISRRRGWLYPALLLGTIGLLSMPFQPVTRYTYLIYPLLVFCSGDLIGALVRRRWTRRASHPAA